MSDQKTDLEHAIADSDTDREEVESGWLTGLCGHSTHIDETAEDGLCVNCHEAKQGNPTADANPTANAREPL